MSVISVRGAGEHNLRDVSVDIPKNELVAFTGVSGSGKSSLVFDTLYAESFRRFADASSMPAFMLGGSVQVRTTRPHFRAITGLPPALGLSQRQGVAGKLSTVGTICGMTDLFRVYYAAFGEVFCRNCDIPLRPSSFPEVVERILTDCVGVQTTIVAPVAERRKGGFAQEIERFRQLGFSKLRVNGVVFDLQDDATAIAIDARKLNTIEVLIDRLVVADDKRRRIERAVGEALEHGKGVVKVEASSFIEKFNTKSQCPQCGESAPALDPRHFSHASLGQCPVCQGTGSSADERAEDLFPCQACHGARLSSERPLVRVAGRTFEEIHQLSLAHLKDFVVDVLVPHAGTDRARQKVVGELQRLVVTLNSLGLSHLNLNRSGRSLVPGDLQRIRLASMISNRLSGALYVLDEPCQGLTAEEVVRLVAVLRAIVDQGASVVVVEHHPVFLDLCDSVFVMGPGAGVHGGQIVEQRVGTHKKKSRVPVSKKMASTHAVPDGREYLLLRKAQVRNISLNKVYLAQGCVTLVRGPAGSGKLSFLEYCVLPALRALTGAESLPREFEKFVGYEASPQLKVNAVTEVHPGSIIRTSRRTVAAALDVLAPLREIFAQLPQSKVLGLAEQHFSWHSKVGRCETCEGRGFIELAQRYGPPVDVECETCLGARLSARSLVPRYKGMNFAELMNLSVEEAAELFSHVRMIHGKLAGAVRFGLGYVKLGQGMDSLSGGELQRLTLTMELRRSTLEGAWFLLVHPGTGLHSPDIAVLGELMKHMTERGASFLLIENREEFLDFADRVLSL